MTISEPCHLGQMQILPLLLGRFPANISLFFIIPAQWAISTKAQTDQRLNSPFALRLSQGQWASSYPLIFISLVRDLEERRTDGLWLLNRKADCFQYDKESGMGRSLFALPTPGCSTKAATTSVWARCLPQRPTGVSALSSYAIWS